MTGREVDSQLAARCAAGDPAAIAAFESRYGPEIDRAAGKIDADAPTREELAQHMREQLLVGPPPKIATFDGRGELLHWLRVVLVRMRRDFVRDRIRASKRAPQVVASPEAASPADDPEFAHIKAHYGRLLREAVEAAMARLSVEQRELLRANALDGLTSEQIAVTRTISAATVRRRITAAREAVWQGTREEIAARLQLSTGEFISIVRLARSQLDVSISRLLGADGKDG